MIAGFIAPPDIEPYDNISLNVQITCKKVLYNTFFNITACTEKF